MKVGVGIAPDVSGVSTLQLQSDQGGGNANPDEKIFATYIYICKIGVKYVQLHMFFHRIIVCICLNNFSFSNSPLVLFIQHTFRSAPTYRSLIMSAKPTQAPAPIGILQVPTDCYYVTA